MRKWLYIVLLGCFAFFGCEDALDMNPENSVTFKNGYETENDMEAATRLCASQMRSIIKSLQVHMGHYADSIASENIRSQRNLSTESAYWRMDDWVHHYQMIGSANAVIKYADQIDAAQERKDFYKGQGYFYRAWTYFAMAQIWGDCVIVGLDADMELFRPKAPWTEVVDQVIADAREAARLLPDYDKVKDSEGNAAQYKDVPCKGAANTLLAYACAWKAGCKYFARPDQQNYDENALWEEAEQACTAVIGSETGAPSGVYRLAATPEEVVTKVFKGNSSEGIYEVQYSPFWSEVGTYPNTTSLDSRAFVYHLWVEYWKINGRGLEVIQDMNMLIKASTVDKWFPKGDLRRDAYFYEFDSLSNPALNETTGGFAYPYVFRDIRVQTSGDDAGQFDHFDYNYIFWRLTDVYLLRAECRARLNKNELAIADLNTVRQRANAKLYDASEYGGDLRYAIFKEREKELVFEDTRYYDIIRNGEDYVRRELSEAFTNAPLQDFIDGCFFYALTINILEGRNTALRQNTWWNRYM